MDKIVRYKSEFQLESNMRAYKAGQRLIGGRLNRELWVLYPFTGIIGFIVGGPFSIPDNNWLTLLGILLTIGGSMIGLSESRSQLKHITLWAGKEYINILDKYEKECLINQKLIEKLSEAEQKIEELQRIKSSE